MEENPYESPRGEPTLPLPRTVPPASMLRTYTWSWRGAVFGAIGAALFYGLFFPVCRCGFATMPSWRASAILLSWLAIVVLVSVSTIVTFFVGAVLWMGYGVRCPGMFIVFVALLIVFCLSLPLFG
jgi:hypothetical protein